MYISIRAIKSKHFVGYLEKDSKDRSVCFGSQTGSQGTRPGACDILGWKLHLRSEIKDWAPLGKTKRCKDIVKYCNQGNDSHPSVSECSKMKSQLVLLFTRNLDLFTFLCLYTCIFWVFWPFKVDLLAALKQGGRLAGRGELEENREETEGRQNSGREREEEDKR